MPFRTVGLNDLPVELLHEIQLYSSSENLPLVSQDLYNVFGRASPFFHAQYILGRILHDGDTDLSGIYSRALRYPICDLRVVQALQQLVRNIDLPSNRSLVRLPKRLFRNLQARPSGWTSEDEPIPFLRFIWNAHDIPRIDTNYPDGYALTRSVHAKFIPLVEFLLDHHASPNCHNRLALKVAIRQKDLKMLKLLVERPQNKKGRSNKRRKLEDRVSLDAELLNTAVGVGATDIVDYLYNERGIVPNMMTLSWLK